MIIPLVYISMAFSTIHKNDIKINRQVFYIQKKTYHVNELSFVNVELFTNDLLVQVLCDSFQR